VKQHLMPTLARLFALGSIFGCGSNPGVLAQINASMKTVQPAYYDCTGKSKLGHKPC
jgi:hypothetical protein